MTNSSAPDNDVYVLDVNSNYNIIGAFDIAGLGNWEQAGLEIDCKGSLWAVNQVTQMVIEADSGETGICNWMDIPWLSESPTSGTVLSMGNQLVTVTFDSTGLTPGTYTAQLRITNNTPYGSLTVPVSMTVSSSPPPPAEVKFPNISVSSSVLDFGNVDLSSSSFQTITVSNTGSGDLNIGNINISGSDTGEFTLTNNNNCSNKTIFASGTCTFDATFAPVTKGEKAATISIASNDPDTPALNISLTGKGVEAEKGCGCGCSISSTTTGQFPDIGGLFIFVVSLLWLKRRFGRKKHRML